VIDLHAHVLPGIDDGPEHLEGSVALARAATECGTHLIAATPHLRWDHPGVRPEELAGRCRTLQDVLADQGVPLRVLPGAEVDLLWTATASADQLRLATYGQRGSDLLLETPYGPLPPNFEKLVEGITDHGIRVLLAHPERNPTVQRDPTRVLELVKRGVLVQVTAMSLSQRTGGSKAASVSRWLIERGVAHVIASDCHSAGPRRSPDRSAAIAFAKSISRARAEWMLHENPQAIIAGEPLTPRPLGPAGQATGTPFRRARGKPPKRPAG
jgi:protein-tyrosine phosphatase